MQGSAGTGQLVSKLVRWWDATGLERVRVKSLAQVAPQWAGPLQEEQDRGCKGEPEFAGEGRCSAFLGETEAQRDAWVTQQEHRSAGPGWELAGRGKKGQGEWRGVGGGVEWRLEVCVERCWVEGVRTEGCRAGWGWRGAG